MVQLAQPVDAQNGQTMTDFTPVPAGDYPIMMTSSEEKTTKKNDGSWFILCNFIILDGEFKDRTLKAILNLGNKNPTAVEIGYKELNTIAQATGQVQVQDTDQFLNIPMLATVKVTGKDEDQYGKQNSIANYQPLNNNGGQAQQNQNQGNQNQNTQQQGQQYPQGQNQMTQQTQQQQNPAMQQNTQQQGGQQGQGNQGQQQNNPAKASGGSPW